MCPCTPCTVSRPLKLPRRPILMVSPSIFSLEGSPTRHQSMRLAALAQHLDHAAGAVDRRSFLVAGDQEGDRAAMRGDTGRRIPRWRSAWPRARFSCRPRRGHIEGRPGSTGSNGSLRHSSERPGRHHIGMAGEAKHRAAAAALRPEIIDRTEAQVLDLEADRLQTLDHQRLAAAVGGTHRWRANQLAGSDFRACSTSEAQYRRPGAAN